MLKKLRNKKVWIPLAVALLVLIVIVVAFSCGKDTDTQGNLTKSQDNIEVNQNNDKESDNKDEAESTENEVYNGEGLEVIENDSNSREDTVTAPSSWSDDSSAKEETNSNENAGNVQDTDDDGESVSEDDVLKDDKTWSDIF